MGSAGQGSYADAAKRLAGRSVYALGSGLVAGGRLVAKGVSALTADGSDREPVRSLRFAHLEWGGGGGAAPQHLPVLLVGLASGFQVWRLDGANPAELVSRRDGPVRLLEVLPEPRAGECGADAACGERPLLAVVPAAEAPPGGGGGAPGGGGAVLLYSLRSHGYVRTLAFSGEVLGLQASARLLVVALRGQLQAFDAASLRHVFSCLTYAPPQPPPTSPGTPSGARARAAEQQRQQFVTDGLTGGGGGDAQAAAAAAPGGGGGGDAQAAAPLAPFALGPRWLAYAADTPVPPAAGQAVAQRLPLARRDSAGSAAGDAGEAAAHGGGTTAAVADAALQAAARSGRQLRAGLAAAGGASLRFLSHRYASWRQGAQQGHDLDALEADAAVAGTVAVRDACCRTLVAAFRAHTSPLAALAFSPGGTLLATASVAGHSVHVFRIVPPPSGGGGGGGGSAAAGHAVHLYRLHRGVTPAAIRGIALAPDAAWLAASSGRGTTHLFHTPGAAGGGGGGEPAAGTGVAGAPGKTFAAGRARKPGLLGGGVAGAASSAARGLYGGQPADAAPIAAAFLPPPAAPGSPGGGAPAAAGAAAAAAAASLYVATADGVLTRHLLRPPPAAAAPGEAGAEAGGEPAAGGESAAGELLEEADRWDVGRHGSWPEREDPLPGPPAGAPPPEPAAGAAGGPPGAEAQQLWVAQAEGGAPGGAADPPPLWRDAQIRFYELQVRQLAAQQGDGADAAAAQLAAVALQEAAPGGGPWLESVPARPLQQQQ